MNVYEKKSSRNMCLKFTHDLLTMKPTTEAVVIPSSFLYKRGRSKVCRWVQLFNWKLWVRQEVLWLQTADRSSGEDRLALWSTQKTINIKASSSSGKQLLFHMALAVLSYLRAVWLISDIFTLQLFSVCASWISEYPEDSTHSEPAGVGARESYSLFFLVKDKLMSH